jgi:hypothetical protein
LGVGKVDIEKSENLREGRSLNKKYICVKIKMFKLVDKIFRNFFIYIYMDIYEYAYYKKNMIWEQMYMKKIIGGKN